MSQIVLYFLHSTPVLSFYVDVVLTLSILMGMLAHTKSLQEDHTAELWEIRAQLGQLQQHQVSTPTPDLQIPMNLPIASLDDFDCFEKWLPLDANMQAMVKPFYTLPHIWSSELSSENIGF